MAEKRGDWSPLLSIQAALAIVSVLSLFAEVVLLMFFEPPNSSKDLINIILGVQAGVGYANVYGFFFGQKEQSQVTERAAAVVAAAKIDEPKPVVVEAPASVEVRPL